MQVAGAANFAASAPAYGCGAAAAPPPRAPPLFVPDESQPHLSPPAPPPLTSSQPPPPAGGGGGVHAMYGPPPGSIGLAAGLSGASGLGSLYPADAGGAGGAAANMAGAGAAPPPAPASGGPVVGVDAAVERGGSAHGGLAKTWVAQASEQQPAGPWGNTHSGVSTRPSATMSASAGPGSASMRAEPTGGVEAEAERAVDAMVYNLKQRFKQSGVTLPLDKQNGAVYRLGSRKLQLSIRNNRLTVRVGSNNIDFLEYLSKAAL